MCSCASYLTDSGDRVELALNGQHPVSEGRTEDDAMSSARKVWDLRELIQEPGAQTRVENPISNCPSISRRITQNL